LAPSQKAPPSVTGNKNKRKSLGKGTKRAEKRPEGECPLTARGEVRALRRKVKDVKIEVGKETPQEEGET